MAIFATAGAMVTAALKEVGIVSEGEVATGEQSNSGLLSFNLLLDELSIDRGMIAALVEDTKALVIGTGSYEIKNGSAVWNTHAPIRIEHGFIRDGNSDTGLDCRMTQVEYNAIPDKTVSGLPSRLFYLNTRASAYVYFDVLPDKAYSAHVFSWKALANTTLVLTSALAFPNGYESAFYQNLLVKLATAPSFNVPISPILVRQAIQAKARIAAMNAVPIQAPLYIPAGSIGGMSKSKFESGDF
jgi:hypothetical protein